MDEKLDALVPHLRALVELADQDGHMTDAAAVLG
ncbi:LysR family transcriptional regulator, partial [Burkholderia multivorans]